MELEQEEDADKFPEIEPFDTENFEDQFSFVDFVEAGQNPLAGQCGHDSQDERRILDFHDTEPQSLVTVKSQSQAASQSLEVGADRSSPLAWQLRMISARAAYTRTEPALLLPWEDNSSRGLFGPQQSVPLPQIVGVPLQQLEVSSRDESDFPQLRQGQESACFVYSRVISDIKDLDYFTNKKNQLETACGQWLDLWSLDWNASGLGKILCKELRQDPSGDRAVESLKSSFGTKSPSTLLKRAAAFRRFVKWHQDWCETQGKYVKPFPLVETDVWAFFLHLREVRISVGRGFTSTSSFLESVRFAKFTVQLHGTEEVLESRRLLGFCAIEKRTKGPSKQAPPLEVEHVQRLREVMDNSESIYDRLGAGALLVCLYARARWSDLRFIHHAELEPGKNGCLVLYTAEHKTSSVGLRREQFLPLVVPREGVCRGEWVQSFLDLYKQAGLDIEATPLGPLMPAPKLGGGFGARPLTTGEAARWLRGLLQGTPNCDSFSSHSLKATLLVWRAKAGMDKEVRAVLGHHCSALTGSDVVYARHLQVRPIRKLQMLLHAIRIGLGFEEIADQRRLVAQTPGFVTPRPFSVQRRTGLVTPEPIVPQDTGNTAAEQAMQRACEDEEIVSVKEQLDEVAAAEEAAQEISLFPLQTVQSGAIQVDSSSGSDSESSGSESSTTEALAPRFSTADTYTEHVPAGLDYYRHGKSGLLHKARIGQEKTACKNNFKNMTLIDRVFHLKMPKCLICFPKDPDRIRNREDLTEALDKALERVRKKDRQT